MLKWWLTLILLPINSGEFCFYGGKQKCVGRMVHKVFCPTEMILNQERESIGGLHQL